MQSFTATAFQRNPADIFNAVQSDGKAEVTHKSRPKMILILDIDHGCLLNTISQFHAAIHHQDKQIKELKAQLLESQG